MIYANIDAEDIAIDGAVYKRVTGVGVKMPYKELIQTLNQFTGGGHIVVVYTTGEISHDFHLYAQKGDDVAEELIRQYHEAC